MEWELFCEEQALECEQRASGLLGQAHQDWLQLAEDWRSAAEDPAPPFTPGMTKPVEEIVAAAI